MNEVLEIQASSPVGRSESPSQAEQTPRQAAESRVCPGTPGMAAYPSPPLTQTRAGYGSPEMVTQTDRQGGPVGREDEPEHSLESLTASPGRIRPRTVKVLISPDMLDRVDALAKASGLCRSHFVSSAFVLGVKHFGDQLNGAQDHA